MYCKGPSVDDITIFLIPHLTLLCIKARVPLSKSIISLRGAQDQFSCGNIQQKQYASAMTSQYNMTMFNEI